MRYDIFFQNNGNKTIYEVLGAFESESDYYTLRFENFELPEGMTDGEYTYVVFINTLKDTTYRYSADILDSVVIDSEGNEFSFRDLKPLTGLMRVGQPEKENIYNNENKKNYYYNE